MSLITYNGESKVIKRICELLDTMTGISFVVVQTLPTTDIQTNVIYLVLKQSAEVDNIYDEYINTDGTSQGWELIGTTEIDLTNYVQFSDLSTVATSGDYDDLIDKPTIPTDFVPKSTGGTFEGNVEIVKANSGTTNVNSVLRLGNDKAVGTEGNTRGAIQIYDQNGYFTNIFPSDNASSRSVFLPKNRPNNSILAVETDLDEVECNVWNLLREPYGHSSGRTQYQVTFTVDSSGQVIANGTATGTASFSVKLVSQNWNLAVGKAYRLTGCPSGGSDSKYRMNIGFRDSNNTDIVTYKEFGNGLDFIVPSNAVVTFVQINVLNGYQATNLTFTPKIVPLDKMDWKSNGILGAKNLNSYPYYETTHSEANISWTDNGDGTVTANNTSTGNSSFICHSRISGRKYPLILPNGKYRISGCPSGGSDSSYRLIAYVTKSGSASTLGTDYGEGAIIEVNGDDNYNDKALVQIGCDIRGSGVVCNNLTFKPMIRLASDTDETYQPYTMTNRELTKKANWVDLGSLTSAITVDDVYSEYRAIVGITVSGFDTKYFTIDLLPNELTSTEKSFTQCTPCQTQTNLSSTYLAIGGVKAKKENAQVTIKGYGNYGGSISGQAVAVAISGNLYAKV